ncbi:MAG: F0F1 ATP synthase subunit A [Oscillospiraceae bacterium]|jgi:F-type H+-transporting ATPase subunit a|nr:F0F1 ATP synthase subunit A [Oscillospiraceae bacterium]
MPVPKIILLIFFAVCAGLGLLVFFSGRKKYSESKEKSAKRLRNFGFFLMVLGAYLLITQLVGFAFGSKHEEFSVELWAERRKVFGFDVSETVVNTWIVMGVLIVLAIVVRLVFLRKMKTVPGTVQNICETFVEKVQSYMNGTVHGLGEMMGSYIFSIAALLIGCAILEMFGLRTPASDITFTLAMAILTFVLINIYGFKVKGGLGRLKSLAEPTPIVLPIKLVTDLAVPVSLASRLFGNMLGGMIIMDLLYSALGNNALGIPSVFGLFFNVFHPLLQAFIFVTLTLTFIKEAVE